MLVKDNSIIKTFGSRNVSQYNSDLEYGENFANTPKYLQGKIKVVSIFNAIVHLYRMGKFLFFL